MRRTLFLTTVFPLILLIAYSKNNASNQKEQSNLFQIEKRLTEWEYYHSLLKSNVLEQFGTVVFTISAVKEEFYKTSVIKQIQFKTETGAIGEMTLIKVGDERIVADGQVLSRGKVYIVDCFGNPCCTEYFSSGEAYCTPGCACRMRITEIQ